MTERIEKKESLQTKICKRCKRRFVVGENTPIAVSERDGVAYGEQLHLEYTFVRCPYCGSPVFMSTSGWSH